jgi:hypothetical protein
VIKSPVGVKGWYCLGYRERERESELAGGALTERELAGRAEVGEVASDVDGEGERE